MTSILDDVNLIIVIPGMGARKDHPFRNYPLGQWWDIEMCRGLLQSTIDDVLGKNKGSVVVRAVDYSGVRAEHGVDRMLDLVTYKQGVSYMRHLANNTAIDVLMYLNSGVGKEVRSSVSKQLNEIVEQERQKYPNRNVNVHLFGHSLGSVVAFDTLQFNENSDTSVLHFETKNAFLIGSPLGLFLTLRYAATHHTDTLSDHKRLLKRTSLYHVFHPFDPVAYRIDPHLDERFSKLEPLDVKSVFQPQQHHSGWTRSTKEKWSSLVNMFSTKTNIEGPAQNDGWVKVTTTTIQTSVESKEKEEPKLSIQDVKAVENSLSDYQRIDHITKPDVFQQMNEYFVSGDVHLKYYSNREVAAFIVAKMLIHE
ncbi:rpoC2 [Acrasis kona]|uniref:RpoC2 n=1 Tax=Acrasis kona TaxID=1008807 RepID=A0AAW2YHJ2_9EUKA